MPATYKEKFMASITGVITKLDKIALTDNSLTLKDEIRTLRWNRTFLDKLHGRDFVPESKSELVGNVEKYMEVLAIKYKL